MVCADVGRTRSQLATVTDAGTMIDDTNWMRTPSVPIAVWPAVDADAFVVKLAFAVTDELAAFCARANLILSHAEVTVAAFAMAEDAIWMR